MKVLLIGDIVGSPGRAVISKVVPLFRRKNNIDFVIANGENAAGGSGLTPKVVEEILEGSVDVITSGDHIWRKKEVFTVITRENRLLRPVNYPSGTAGSGFCVYKCGEEKIAVVNVVGRVFMESHRNPFLASLEAIREISRETDSIFVDIHAEATSEKLALAYFLDGKVTAVFGTHTHIQTADERLMSKGTAYITDLGMTGPFDSVLGRKSEQIVERFISEVPAKFEVAENNIQMQGAVVDFNPKTGRALSIKRVVEMMPVD